MKYSIEVLPRAIKELEKIPDPLYRRIVSIIDNLKYVPRPVSTLKLKGYESRWRIRVGDYRILYEIDNMNRIITITKVGHRKDIYKV